MKDILKDKSLKAMPYEVPEGYFEGLRSSLERKNTGPARVWIKYVAIAASVILFAAAGGWFISNKPTNTLMYDTDGWYAEAATEDDMIEYLIYIGAEIDELY